MSIKSGKGNKSETKSTDSLSQFDSELMKKDIKEPIFM